jgi:hypothetical protein
MFMGSFEIPVFNRANNHHKFQSARLNLVSGGVFYGVNTVQQSVITFEEIIDTDDKLKWCIKFFNECLKYPPDPRCLGMDNPGFYYIILEQEGVLKTVGFISVLNYVSSMHADDNCLDLIYIDPNYRKMGIYTCILGSDLILGTLVEWSVYDKYEAFFNKLLLFKKKVCDFCWLLVK